MGVPGRTLNDFRAQFDRNVAVPAKIDAALKAIGDEYRYALEFAREAGVSTNDLAAFRERYVDYIVVIKNKDSKPKDVWFGSKAMAAKAREMVR